MLFLLKTMVYYLGILASRIINLTTKTNAKQMFDSLIVKYKKACNFLNISLNKILQGTKHVKHIFLCNFNYVTYLKKSILSELFRIFCFEPLINPHFKKDIENSCRPSLYSKSKQTYVTHRVSRKLVQPFSSDAIANDR